MTRLGRVAVVGSIVEVAAWMLATLLHDGSWRYNISALYASNAPQPWLVMIGEASFSVGLAALAVGLRRSLAPSDQRMVGCALLAIASVGTMAGAIARNSCDESLPQCEGSTFVTTADWVHGIGSLVEMLGIVGAIFVLATALPRPWSLYSVATGAMALAAVFAWAVVPYPWVGTNERILALVLTGWTAAMGVRLTMAGRWTEIDCAVPGRDATRSSIRVRSGA